MGLEPRAAQLFGFGNPENPHLRTRIASDAWQADVHEIQFKPRNSWSAHSSQQVQPPSGRLVARQAWMPGQLFLIDGAANPIFDSPPPVFQDPWVAIAYLFYVYQISPMSSLAGSQGQRGPPSCSCEHALGAKPVVQHKRLSGTLHVGDLCRESQGVFLSFLFLKLSTVCVLFPFLIGLWLASKVGCR